MTDDELRELAALYAIDALPPDEAALFEAHLRTSPALQAEVVEIREVAAELAEASLTTPPPGLRDRVLAEAHRTEQVPPIEPTRPVAADDAVVAPVSLDARRRRRRWAAGALSAAAAVALVAVGLVALPQLRQSELEQLAAAPDAVRLDLAPNVEVVGEDPAPEGEIEVIWSADRDQVGVVASDLPDPGPGQAYQLWFVVDDGVAPAALFDPDQGVVSEVLSVEDLTAVGWGVTIEPDTGSDLPTSDILFVGVFS